jgi:isoquinoline 1-oxidoreductase subunit beta
MSRVARERLTSGSAVTRRHFVITTALASGGLLLHGAEDVGAAAQASIPNQPVALNAWVRIAPDNRITIISSQAEMGQGIQTTLPAVLADELGADWQHVTLENAVADPVYRNPRVNWQFTGNSESTTAFFDLMRDMGAKAREMLIATAARRWNVKPSECHTALSYVVHQPSRRRIAFGRIAAEAATQIPPVKPRLKPTTQWTLVGKALPRVENQSKVDGTAIFGIDVVRPDMVYAAVRMNPVFGGGPAKFDKSSIAAFPRVIDVVPIPDGVAVVGNSYWEARRALDSLQIDFDAGANRSLSTATLRQQYRAALDGDSWHTVHTGGDTNRSFASTFTAEYESQFLAHATMEPMNCSAHVTDDRCDIWAPTQGQELQQIVLSQALKLPKERITINRTLLGGGFGRRLVADFVLQAALVSKAVRRPVKLIWSREEDTQHDIYRPAVLHRLTSGIDEFGRLQYIDHKLVSPSILQFVYPPAVTNVFDPSCCEGLLDRGDERGGLRYRIPRTRVDFKLLKVGVPTSVLQTTGYGPNLFAVESFVDELAHRKGQDPYHFRRELLGHDERALRVLDLAAQRAAWTSPAPPGHYRGIAFCEAFRTLTAYVVEISVPKIGMIKIHKVVCAVDPGTVLDPGISANSIEGGVAWGLSCAFKSEITFADGRVVESNFHDYQVLRMHEMPTVDVYFVNSGACPLGGIGEVGPVTVIPALTNAIFAATGRRYRSLPLSRHGLTLASMAS